MANFNKHYIKLLRDQVEVEIKFLKSMGHSKDLIDDPCIFCYEARRPAGDARTNGDFVAKYKCNRLTELLNFMSQLQVREKTSYDIPQHEYTSQIQRLKIGTQAPQDSQCGLLPFNPVKL